MQINSYQKSNIFSEQTVKTTILKKMLNWAHLEQNYVYNAMTQQRDGEKLKCLFFGSLRWWMVTIV